jgi:hypothetical protein
MLESGGPSRGQVPVRTHFILRQFDILILEQGGWLPPRKPPRQDGTFAVPRIPTLPIIRAAYTYDPGREFTLLPNLFFPTSNYEHEEAPLSEKARVRIIRPVSIGYHHRSQICLVEIIEHETLARGTKAIMRVYDHLYIRPDSLHTIPLPRIFPATMILISAIQTQPSRLDLYAQSSPSAQVFTDNASEASNGTYRSSYRSSSPTLLSSSTVLSDSTDTIASEIAKQESLPRDSFTVSIKAHSYGKLTSFVGRSAGYVFNCGFPFQVLRFRFG